METIEKSEQRQTMEKFLIKNGYRSFYNNEDDIDSFVREISNEVSINANFYYQGEFEQITLEAGNQQPLSNEPSFFINTCMWVNYDVAMDKLKEIEQHLINCISKSF
ncbi:hypothetical protein V9L05_18935 [Bernardetia sp. Wsw4-3y2]|uniref:hypothetical protein n=1 Tax=Bernardetia sp. Wsw4-3y2 TaxID=3127471 RepID=UPI0030CC4C6F